MDLQQFNDLTPMHCPRFMSVEDNWFDRRLVLRPAESKESMVSRLRLCICLLVALSAVISDPKYTKSFTISSFSPSTIMDGGRCRLSSLDYSSDHSN